MDQDAAVDAALRAAAAALGGARVGLYLAGPGDRLELARATGDTPDLSSIAEMLGGAPVALDLQHIAEGTGPAMGVGWGGPPRGALLALLPGPPTATTEACVLDAASVAAALTAAAPEPLPDAVRLLADLAVRADPFDERLAMALERLADLLGMEAATLALLDAGEWRPLVAHDPVGLTPTVPVPLGGTPGALIAMSDGPVGVADGGEAFGAFLGAPVLVDGHCEAVLCTVSSRPRVAFSEAERDLVAALARWAAAALTGRRSAAHLAERETTLASFFDTVPLALGTLDLDATAPGGVRLVTANVHAARSLGAADLLPADASAAALAPWAEACRHALSSGAPARFSFDLGAEGQATHHDATVVVLDAAVPRFSFVTEDVTERDAAARATAALRRAEASASDARRALVTQVTHDLRSPLTAILGYAELLHESAEPDDIAEARQVIVRAGQHILEALDHLSALALVDARPPDARTPPVDVAAVVEAVVEAHRLPASAHRTALHVEVAVPAAPVALDPEQFERLLRTLVAAAVSATVDGHVDGRVSVDGDALVVDLLARPAEPGAGLGPLGTDFVRRLVGVMGGEVDERTALGDTGWRWTLRLPYRPRPSVAPAVAPAGALALGEIDAVDVCVLAG